MHIRRSLLTWGIIYFIRIIGSVWGWANLWQSLQHWLSVQAAYISFIGKNSLNVLVLFQAALLALKMDGIPCSLLCRWSPKNTSKLSGSALHGYSPALLVSASASLVSQPTISPVFTVNCALCLFSPLECCLLPCRFFFLLFLRNWIVLWTIWIRISVVKCMQQLRSTEPWWHKK